MYTRLSFYHDWIQSSINEINPMITDITESINVTVTQGLTTTILEEGTTTDGIITTTDVRGSANVFQTNLFRSFICHALLCFIFLN